MVWSLTSPWWGEGLGAGGKWNCSKVALEARHSATHVLSSTLALQYTTSSQQNIPTILHWRWRNTPSMLFRIMQLLLSRRRLLHKQWLNNRPAVTFASQNAHKGHKILFHKRIYILDNLISSDIGTCRFRVIILRKASFSPERALFTKPYNYPTTVLTPDRQQKLQAFSWFATLLTRYRWSCAFEHTLIARRRETFPLISFHSKRILLVLLNN